MVLINKQGFQRETKCKRYLRYKDNIIAQPNRPALCPLCGLRLIVCQVMEVIAHQRLDRGPKREMDTHKSI